MLEKIKEAIKRIESLSASKPIKIVSHFDTDGITSAAIFSRAMERWGKSFSLEIVKGLDEDFVKNLPEDHVLIFLDLASGSLGYLEEKKTEVFIFDHHEIVNEIPENVMMINPILNKEEPISAAAICYLMAKEISEDNRDLANLAVLGMVGDLHEKTVGKVFEEILNDSETILKKGLMIYPSTRPLDRSLEYSSNPYIPGVSGSRPGVLKLLREADITSENGKFKALCDLDKEEMTRLITAIVLRSAGKSNQEDIIGNLYLVKFFNKLEDARELSALINACSRMGSSEVALGFCLGNRKFKEISEKIYIGYKQKLVAALKYVSEMEKMSGKDYLIINGKDKIKDTIIGTVASIVSHSPLYSKGQIIIALAYNDDKIKVSARVSGKDGRNVREVLSRAVVPVGGEVGGHPNAAGCLIMKNQEEKFISELRKVLDIEVTKV